MSSSRNFLPPSLHVSSSLVIVLSLTFGIQQGANHPFALLLSSGGCSPFCLFFFV